MRSRIVQRTLLIGIALSLCLTPLARAEVRYLGETVSKYFFTDSDTQHPRKMDLLLVVQDDYRHLAEVGLLAAYSRSMAVDEPARRESGSRFKAVIHVLRDGQWEKVGKLTGRVYLDGDEAEAEIFDSFDISLGPWDILRFRFTCKRFPTLLEGAVFQVQAAVIAEFPEDDD